VKLADGQIVHRTMLFCREYARLGRLFLGVNDVK
jgi:hypothetical protein